MPMLVTIGDMSSYVVKTAALILIRKDEQRLSQGAAPKSWDTAHTADRVLDIGKVINMRPKLRVLNLQFTFFSN